MADEESKQKPEGSEQKPEGSNQNPEGSKNKLISSISNEELQRWQTFILALIIIFAYIVFFGYIITTAEDMPDQKGKNWSGMTTLTGTFGIIAAAVVGYYFGQRNLKQAGDIAQHAIETSKVAQEVADKKTIEAKKKDDKLKTEIKTGKKFYETFNKITDPSEKGKTVAAVVQEHDKKSVEDLNNEIKKRLDHLETVSNELEDQE